MAKRSQLIGIVITSSIRYGTIKSIELPPNSGDFIIVDASDVRATNRVRIVDNYLPVFADKQVSYKGQPIMAVFAPDYESLIFFSQELKIEYEAKDIGEAESYGSPIIYSYGDNAMEASSKEGLMKVESSYLNKPYHLRSSSLLRVNAAFSGDSLQITTPTQWPMHVRDTVATAMELPKSQVHVENVDYYAPNDELLTLPSFLSVIAALGARKSGKRVQVRASYETYKPLIQIKRTTWLSSEGVLEAEIINAFVDMGFCPVFSVEFSEHLASGLAPFYPVKAVSISVSIQKSHYYPSSFFGDIGYPAGIASTELHYCQVALALKQIPLNWKKSAFTLKSYGAKVIRTADASRAKEVVDDVCQRSDYIRKFTAYSAQKQGNWDSLFSVPRGVGFAAGPAVSGFSNHFQYLDQYSIKVRLEAGDKAYIETSFTPSQSVSQLWSDMVSSVFKIKSSNVKIEQSELNDSGPDVLSSDISRIPRLIKMACDDIASRRFKDPLPLTSTVYASSDPSGPVFTSASWVAVVVDLSIDQVLLVPKVRKITATLFAGRVFDQDLLKQKIRRAITLTLMSIGSRPDENMAIDIKLIAGEGGGEADSMNQAIKGLLIGAFSSAMCQALGACIAENPINSQTIFQIMKGAANEDKV